MLALGWLLSSTTPPSQRIAAAISALRIYGFDEGKPLANSPEAVQLGVFDSKPLDNAR